MTRYIQLIMDNFVYILSFVPCIKDNKGILQSYTKPVLRKIITIKFSIHSELNEKPKRNQFILALPRMNDIMRSVQEK